MSLLLKIHRPLDENGFGKLWQQGLFVFDTNVLLNLYRLPESVKEDFIKILHDPKIKNRIWVPFQVSMEFLNNRISVISDQKKAFGKVENALSEYRDLISNAFEEMSSKISKMQLDTRHSLIAPGEFTSNATIEPCLVALDEQLQKLEKLNKQQPDVNEEDRLFETVEKIFTGKMGECFSTEELEQIYKEGQERYEARLPPGYKDQSKGATNEETGEAKSEFYFYADKQIRREYGDLIIWKEIIQKAKREELTHIVFVTDELKEHWVRERRGRKLGVRYELLNEIYFQAPTVELFHIYNTANFMEYAKKHLKIAITTEAIEKTRELTESDRKRSRDKLRHELEDMSQSLARNFISPNLEIILLREAQLTEVRFATEYRDFILHMPSRNLRTLVVAGIHMLTIPSFSVATVSRIAISRPFADESLYRRITIEFRSYPDMIKSQIEMTETTKVPFKMVGEKSFAFGVVRAFSSNDGRSRLRIYIPKDLASRSIDHPDQEYLI